MAGGDDATSVAIDALIEELIDYHDDDGGYRVADRQNDRCPSATSAEAKWPNNRWTYQPLLGWHGG